MTDQRFDLIVLGSGPGGYIAAIRASQLGMKTAIVEREQLGGICLNWGCIPTKALLRAAEIHHLLQHASEFGFAVGEVRCDFPKLIARSRKVAKRLAAGVKHLMKKNGIEIVSGHGRLAGPGRLRIAEEGGQRDLLAPSIVLATGARARALPGLEPDGERIWTYREAMVPEALPGSLLVVGSGAIGAEFASFYRDMGAEVTLVEILPQILPLEDAEIAGVVRKAFEKSGMQIHTEATVASVESRGKGVAATLRLAAGETREIEVDRVILAVGVVGNLEDIGLETTAVQVDSGHIVANEWTETAEPGIYAIGDVAGPPWLAHKASAEGVLCAEKIAGVSGLQPLDTDSGVYLLPAAGRQSGAHGAGGREGGVRGEGRTLPVQGQRQGGRARRHRRPGEDGLRRQHRRASGGAHGRRRRDGDDPGLRDRPKPGDHGRRADAHDLPASDALRVDARVGPRRLRAGPEQLARISHQAAYCGRRSARTGEICRLGARPEPGSQVSVAQRR
jgi:dihydrolipoamide dehydrogenase